MSLGLLTTAMRPFAVGGNEGGGGWLLNAQSLLTHAMARELHALSSDSTAIWALIGGGLLYGVAHAAGPGHGKAVIASYMMANEAALKRGLVLALLAAMLQGAVAVALVGVGAALFRATSSQMNVLADDLAQASYLGVALIGAWLCWRKGGALVRALVVFFARRAETARGGLYVGAPWRPAAGGVRAPVEEACDHLHAPDASRLGAGFSWRAALMTVIAAGARPCSGSLLILVFALAQGLFWAGVAGVAAVSLGTAVTTGALATLAVYAKGLAVRLASGESARAALVARGFEFAAALAVLGFGLTLYWGAGGAV